MTRRRLYAPVVLAMIWLYVLIIAAVLLLLFAALHPASDGSRDREGGKQFGSPPTITSLPVPVTH